MNCLGWRIRKCFHKGSHTGHSAGRDPCCGLDPLFWGNICLLSFTSGISVPAALAPCPALLQPTEQRPSHLLLQLTLLFNLEKTGRFSVVSLSGFFFFNQKESWIQSKSLALQILTSLAEYQELLESSFHRAVWPTSTDGDEEHTIWARFLLKYCRVWTGKFHAVSIIKRSINMVLACFWTARRTTWKQKMHYVLILQWLLF